MSSLRVLVKEIWTTSPVPLSLRMSRCLLLPNAEDYLGLGKMHWYYRTTDGTSGDHPVQIHHPEQGQLEKLAQDLAHSICQRNSCPLLNSFQVSL